MSDARPGTILAVRALPGANCSSVGSVIDLLFVGGAVGAALLLSVSAMLDDRPAPPEAAAPSPGEPDEEPR